MSDTSEVSAQTEPPTAPPKLSPWRLRRGVVIACFLAVVVIGVGATVATWRFNHAVLDPTPLPRPWINAPYITTPPGVVDAMLKAAQVKEGELLYDLGCGDGRIAITAAADYGCRAKGFDIDPDRIRDSRANAKTMEVQELVAFEQRDVFTLDLSQADVVAMYLLPRYLTRLLPQFAEMRPGTRIVSHDFRIKGVPPDKTITVTSPEDGQNHLVHLWITPLKMPAEEE